jgi:apolipoprotein N-acyltransferase
VSRLSFNPDGRRLLFALFAGAALPLAFAPFEISIIAILSIAILFNIWLDCRPGQAFLCGYFFGLGLFGIGVNWLHISINLFGGVNLGGAIFITLILIAFLSLFPAFAGFIAVKFLTTKAARPALLAGLPTAWVFTEWCRSWVFTGFPWLTLGYTQTNTAISAIAPVLGIYAVSWLVCLLAALTVYIFRTKQGVQAAFAFGAIIIIVSGSLILDQVNWTTPDAGEKQVALIQGAVPQEIKWDPDQKQPSIDLYLNLSEPYWDGDLIIWPETAIPMFYHQAKPLLENLLELVELNDTDLLTGIPIYLPEEKKFYNSVIVLRQDELDIYHKNHLVPFGEYLPLDKWLRPVLDSLGIPMSDFSAGNHDPVITAAGVAAGISICYEDVFGEEVTRALPESRILINVSNDAWFGDSLAPHQHLQIARMRAKETGRFLLRSTNTGISAIIDEKGRIINQSPQFKPHALSARIKTFHGRTPYSIGKNYPVLILLSVFFLYFISLHFRRNNHPRRS